MKKFFFVFLCVLLIAACSKKQIKSIYPEKLPVLEKTKELMEMPVYLPKIEGAILSLELDEKAPFAGILLSEEKAFSAGELRISYDEIYQLYLVNRLFFLRVIELQGKAIYKADLLIVKKDDQIDKLYNSWWARHKFTVGVGFGLVVGVAAAVISGTVMAEIGNNFSGNSQ